MKTRTLSLLGVGVVLVAALTFTGCMKNSARNATLKMSATTTKTKGSLKSATVSGPIQLVAGTLTLTNANVNISDLQIEENSGNDVEQQAGEQNNIGTDKNEGTESKSEKNDREGTDAEDILLTGPFSLDISSGEAIIDQVNVYPGTFKKVDFTFLPNSDAPYNGSSIVLTGSYEAPDGTITPFELYSDFAKQVQLPLANGGVTVQSNATVSISIVFDLNTWLASLDLSSATVTGGKIVIDKTNNAALLEAFHANLATSIDIEHE